MGTYTSNFCDVWMCLCEAKKPAVNGGGVMRPEGFEYSCPATHCLPRQWDISLCFTIPSSLSISTIAKNLSRQESPSSAPPLLSAYSLFLYLRSASMRHYLPSSILFIEESPPTSPPAELPHYHQSASSLLWREIGVCSYLPFSLHCLIHPLSLHLWHHLCSFFLCFCLSRWSPVFNSIYFFPLRPWGNARFYKSLIKFKLNTDLTASNRCTPLPCSQASK